jgi:flagellar biosynthesis protein FlhF
MQIKKFVAPSLKEATRQMKNDLGDEAIILGTRVIEGDKRFKMNKMYEITAGIDKPVHGSAEKNPQGPLTQRKSYDAEVNDLTKKIFNSTTQTIAESSNLSRKEKTPITKNFDSEIKEIAETLQMHEVQKNITATLIKHLSNSATFMERANLENYLVSSMASMLKTKEFKVTKGKSKKIALVGPTGVGKTTCIAKLAVISKIIHKLNVGLISIDTYRLGAIDQLRIFSEISDIEMAVAYEPEEIPKLVKKFKDKDLVFIDTVGRSQKNKENLDQIKKYLQAAQVDETILVVSSTSSSRNLNDVAERFKNLEYSSVIFSKIDEAVAYGNIMNLVVTQNVPVMFLTNGQVIPDDIISVNPPFLANMIYSGKLYK